MRENNKTLSNNLPADSPPLAQPTISIIIPLYNTEEYIGECLDSVFLQTFQDFEVIVVDDCSTDNSVAIVESYVDKFNGRLRITKTKVNSGGGGYIPRNIGLNLANGEYVWFVDADDFILLNALETLYNAAKEYDADVVYTGSHYELKTSTDFFLHRDGEGKKLLKDGLEDKPDLRIDDQNKNLQVLLLEEREGNFRTPWSKFIRRDFLIQNEIVFPNLTSAGDFIWVINIYCYAKRFLRIPTALYFYRRCNTRSVTQTKRAPVEQVSFWFKGFIAFLNCLSDLEKKNKILSEKPAYCRKAFESHLNWCLHCSREARKQLSDEEIYEILHREFAKEISSSNLQVPFLFSMVNADRRISEDRLKNVEKLEKEISILKDHFVCPTISIIIPLYNSEKYIAECLDSLIEQTFQNFEVVVVDDCSTDSSCEIVEQYIPKFNGRLKLCQMDKNTGSGALPRNRALSLSCGEYIQCLDADDMLTKTALEELYTLAKKYDADVVYCEKYYMANKDGDNIRVHTYQQGPFVDKPTPEPEDLKERVQRIIANRYLTVPWNKLVRRNLIMENEILFPHLKTSEDNIWSQGLIFYAKKFLRVPNLTYIYRQTEESSQRKKRTSQQLINFWLDPVLHGLKSLDKLMSRHEFFKANPSCRYELLKKFIDARFSRTSKDAKKMNEENVYSAIKDEFGEKLGEYDVLIPALCNALYVEKNFSAEQKAICNSDVQIFNRFAFYLTARIDIKLISNIENGDLQIISVSDDKAGITELAGRSKKSIAYKITSYVGKLEFVVRSTVDGRIQLNLLGREIRDKEDKSKLVPYWIDYTLFTVNEQTIFDTFTPVWYKEPYSHSLDVKADEEIVIKIEWFPHRSDTTSTKEIAQNNQSEAEIEKLSKRIAELEKYNADCAQLIHNFAPYLTARIDIRQFQKKARGNFQIVSMSDDKANISKPAWIQKSGVGYTIESYSGKMEFVVTSTVSGNIQLDLRGKQIRDPMNKTKRVPYWIDYTLLIVNGHTVFDTLTPAWHDKVYRHIIKAVAGEEITIQVEWFPHRSDT